MLIWIYHHILRRTYVLRYLSEICTYHNDLLKENPAAVYAKNMSIGGPIIDFNDGLKNVNEGSLRIE